MNETDLSQVLEATDFIHQLTDSYLQHIGGSLTADNMDQLNANQHTLLAYRFLLDEVMEGGFIQLIQNGYGPYVLDGPFAMMMKKHWELVDFGKFMYEVKKEYHLHKAELEADLNEEQFMALYEQQEKMNELGDEFLDKYQEIVTPSIADYVRKNEEKFVK
jgi:hypothetical protein